MALEDLFNAATLEVIVPEDVHEIPDEPDEDWLQCVTTTNQREKAFFDERLLLFFTVNVSHPSQEEPADPRSPPLELATFLSRLQITLNSKYISPQPNVRQTSHLSGINLTLPPRSQSYHKAAHASAAAATAHPSIFPPHTPNPTPQTGQSDRKYVGVALNAEGGTVLESFVWGETARDEPEGKNFALIWSTLQSKWVAVYRITLGIAFLRTSVPEPVLSLTVSATLREKSLPMTPYRQALAAILERSGFAVSSGTQPSAVPMSGHSASQADEDELHGLQEINLLDGLLISNVPSLVDKDTGGPLTFPSTRLAASYRRSAFTLSTAQSTSNVLATPTTAATPAIRGTTSTILRKSFLKTLQTVSGFQIRMKSVFVPYVAIPGTDNTEEERREAGSEERTVVLSVELANGSSAIGPGSTGFAVENIDVLVGGEGATAHLLKWGESGVQKNDSVFPLLVGPADQFNLLYAITFLRQSESDEVADALRQEANGEQTGYLPRGDLQRPVTIIVHGKPFDFWRVRDKLLDNPKDIGYLTQAFPSRWNCILDLSANGQPDYLASSEPLTAQDALPEPATPFPAKTPTSAKYPAPLSQDPSLPGTKRHTVGARPSDRLERIVTTAQYRNSTSILNPARNVASPTSITDLKSPTNGQGRFTPKLPSASVKGPARLGGTTAITNIPSSPRTPDQFGTVAPPRTLAYPAYPSDTAPQVPASQSPLSSFRNSGTGYTVEPQRERAKANAGVPQTPGPHVVGASFADEFRYQEDNDNPIVVSVGLMPPSEEESKVSDLIYVFGTFSIEIFVFNRSERTRRFEVSYPDNKRRRQQDRASIRYSSGSDTGNNDNEWRQAPGIVPLENRVRVGPLRPHTCQSVRMQFLALRPGIHPIASLTLTDVESGFSKNLKSVMDIIVHENEYKT